MKKIILLLSCVFCVSIISAQRSSFFAASDRLFQEGKAFFEDKNYAGCRDKILQYKKQPSNIEQLQEADFLLAACDFHQGNKSVEQTLQDYLDTYPQSYHRNEICFMLGSIRFQENDYSTAEYWFNQCELNLLSESQQEDYAYRKGIICLKQNDNTEAFRLFSLLNKRSSRYLAASDYYLAYLYYKEGRYDEASSRFTYLKNHSEFRPEVLYYLTQIHFVQERYAQTIQEGRELLQSYPNHTYHSEMNRIIGISYYYEGNYEQAIQYLEQFMDEENPTRSSFHASEAIVPKDYAILGLAYYRLGDYALAAEYFNRSNPGEDVLGQSIYLYLGQSYLQLKDYTNALRSFESASRMNFDLSAKEAASYNYAMLLYQNSVSGFGESVTALENFINSYPNSIYADKVNDALVEVYLTTKNYDTALASIAKIKNPGKKILEAKQKIYYYLGTFAFSNANYTQAVDYFTKAIDSGNYANQEKENAIYWRGESYYRTNDYTNAATNYRAFLNTGRNNELAILANYNLGYCAFKQAQYSSAENYFKTYINRGKANVDILADAYSRLGDCYFYQRRFQEAQEAYNQSANTSPTGSDYALFQKGYVMGLQKDYNGKIVQMDKLIRDFPASTYISDALYEKGRAYVLLNNPTAAINTYQELLSKYPESSSARKAGLQIGLLYYNANQPQKSTVAYKNVIAKYPGSEEAQVALQDLKSVYMELNDLNGYADYVRSLGGAVQFSASEQDSLTYLAAERVLLKGDVKEAQKSLNNYLQAFPKGAFSTNAHYYLANSYYEQKNFPQSKKEYLNVLASGDNQFTEEALGRTAELQYNDREYEAALASYERLQTIAASKTNRDAGALGVIRSAAQLKKDAPIILAANALLKDKTISPEIAIEAKYYRAKAYWNNGEKALLEADLKDLAKDTRTAYGAEAKYLLAQHYFNTENTAEAQSIIQNYIQQGTPHVYWLARSYILFSDIFVAKKDKLQARQYLESLQTNYKNTSDDIHSLIQERLQKLK